jgi:flagellar basal body P-ring formation protein FlgA
MLLSRLQPTDIARLLFVLSMTFTCHIGCAETVRWQKSDVLQQLVEDFLRPQLPNNTRVQVKPMDTSLRVQACQKPEIFIPNNTTGILRGTVRIGARCTQPQQWTVYLGVNIQETKAYFVTSTALEANHILGSNDVHLAQGWSDELPSGVVVDGGEPWQGLRLTQAVPSGTPLQRQWLRFEYVINVGQTVKVKTQTLQFQVSSEGKALNRAAVGQEVQVRTSSGQVISGKAQLGGWVEVAF